MQASPPDLFQWHMLNAHKSLHIYTALHTLHTFSRDYTVLSTCRLYMQVANVSVQQNALPGISLVKASTATLICSCGVPRGLSIYEYFYTHAHRSSKSERHVTVCHAAEQTILTRFLLCARSHAESVHVWTICCLNHTVMLHAMCSSSLCSFNDLT